MTIPDIWSRLDPKSSEESRQQIEKQLIKPQ